MGVPVGQKKFFVDAVGESDTATTRATMLLRTFSRVRSTLGRTQCAPSLQTLSAVPEMEHEDPESLIVHSPSSGLHVVDLNRPKALSALNAEMVTTLRSLLQGWHEPDSDAKLILFRGNGRKAFCAGDIRQLLECARGGEDATLEAYSFFQEEYILNHEIGTSRIPVVSLLDGEVMGGGVGLSVHGTIRVATEKTVFAMPGAGACFQSPRFVVARCADKHSAVNPPRHWLFPRRRWDLLPPTAGRGARHVLGPDRREAPGTRRCHRGCRDALRAV